MKQKLIGLMITFTLFLSLSVFAVETSTMNLPQFGIQAKPIPPGYHFPTPAATIQQWIAESNNTKMREHAWDLWMGMNSNSGEKYNGRNLPIWETWFGSDDVFPDIVVIPNDTNVLDYLTAHRHALHEFVQPHQLTHMKRGLTLLQVLGPQQDRLLAFNKFNPQAAAFIMTPKSGPGGQTYYYNSGESLMDLNNAWPSGTSGQDRGINDFPIDAIETKPAFGIVSATGLTVMPLWLGPSNSTNPEFPTLDTWTTCVLIDPKGKSEGVRPATKSEIARANPTQGLSCQHYLYGSLSLFYSFKLDATEAALFSKARGGGVSTNDYAVLLGMHVNTHETPFWTWQTYYWQPGADTPNGFPGSKANQPKELKSPWKNYASCVNYAQTTTPTGDKMDVCFSPYFETTKGIPSGLSSNCMSCHGTARVVVNDDISYPNDYLAPIQFYTDPLYYNSSTTHTEFSWALADSVFLGNATHPSK